jgi:hypothetical protein
MAAWEASQWVEDTMPNVPRSVGRVVRSGTGVLRLGVSGDFSLPRSA